MSSNTWSGECPSHGKQGLLKLLLSEQHSSLSHLCSRCALCPRFNAQIVLSWLARSAP